MNNKKLHVSFALTLILGLTVLIPVALGAVPQVTLARPLSTEVSGTISSDTTWDLAGSPYIVTGDVTVDNDVTLTVVPGVEVRFDSNTGMYVNGALRAVGTVAQPITFTANVDTPAAGEWTGIHIDDPSDDALTRLEYCTISYGGKAAPFGGFSRIGNLVLQDASPTVQNCIISHSSRYGLDMSDSSPTVISNTFSDNGYTGLYDRSGADTITMPTIRGNIFNGNGTAGWRDAAARVSPNTQLGSNTLTNNINNYIEIKEGTITADRTWPVQMGGAYAAVGNVTVDTGVTLTVTPGVEVRFNNNIGLYVNGALRAVGTSAQPITFTANVDTPAAGEWTGIHIDDPSDDALTRLEYCTISYGGKAAGLGGFTRNGNLVLHNASPAIQNCTISHSSHYGLDMSGSAPMIISNTFSHNSRFGLYDRSSVTAPTIRGNTFNGNGTAEWSNHDAAARVSPNSLLGDNTLTGNTTNHIQISKGTVTTDNTWPTQTGGAYIAVGDVGVQTGVTLTIKPGVEIRFDSDTGLYVTGTLRAVGTSNQPITFTANVDTPEAGAWTGIHLDDSSDETLTRLEYCAVGYGGQTAPSWNDVSWHGNLNLYNAFPTIQNCIISHSGKYGLEMYNSHAIIRDTILADNGDSTNAAGLHATNNSVITATRSTFQNNAGYGIWVENGHANLACATVTNNGNDGIYLVGVTALSSLSSAIHDNAGLGLNNTTGITVNVPYNWWGDASGPTHSSNPEGMGEEVSDNVLFTPWQSGSECVYDLSVTKADAPDPVTVGVSLTYVITVANAGPGDVTGAILTDMLPTGVTFISSNASPGTGCDAAGSTVTCNLGDLAADTMATATIAVIPRTVGIITNTVSVAGDETELDTANNTATTNTAVRPRYIYLPLVMKNHGA